MASNPTVVLVHGAFADASGFAGVIRQLQSKEVEVRAPMNPLRSLAFDADAIARYANGIDGPVTPSSPSPASRRALSSRPSRSFEERSSRQAGSWLNRGSHVRETVP